MDKPKSMNIAKWGAACAPCATSKAKCMRSTEATGAKCDRCERLEKACVEQVHKPRKKRQTKPSKTAQLEERLNSLVDLLKATNSGELPASLRDASLSEDSTCIPSEIGPLGAHPGRSTISGNSTPTSESSDSIGVVPSTYNCYAPPTCICRAPIGEAPIAVESDETLLSIFVTKLSPAFPFVVLRPGISAREMEKTKPILFAAIKMVSSVRNLKSMMAQGYAIMRHITEHLLMRSQRSLELLQSILVVIGFYHYQCMMHTQMSNLTALACSLAADLGIVKPPEVQERTRMLVLNPESPNPRTNDERRALCGMWYMSSVVSFTFQRTDSARYTPYIDQCLRELEAGKEVETDALLAQLMRIQHLSDRIGQLQSKDKVDDSLPGIPRAPVSAYLNAFQTELEKFKEQIPRHLRGHTKLKLWEPPAVDVKILDSLSDTFTSFSLDGPSALDVFYRAHGALKSWFEFWLSIDITDYFYLPMPVCAQLLVAVTLLSRWAKLAGADPYNASSNTLSTLHTKPTAEGLMDPSSYELSANAVAEPKFPDAEPAVASAIAKIKAHIRSQPGLQLDVVGILRALVSRFEQARSEVSEVQGGAWENNIWDLAAKKISITKLKLERWAEIVSAVGAEGLLARKYLPGDGPIQDGVESSSEAAAVASPMEGVEKSQSIEFMQQPAGPDGWQYNNNNFAHDLFDGLGLDQNFFYDDGGDYGTAILNNLNNFNGFTYQGPAI
ncbi:hypothetical protein BKA67DRAFT_520710 [Truncatella angustata]|uniref:Zn(2)-C6 fungal-type domain-containing protein n=1 Tax=Truncatella angustata TaxID=152316 RepID=A0A9P8ZUR9_9PEZI|nr:uncharacterized protein BKA67DRAFT_520710 [Truncatella angustata]KAH6651480.1 hypothetical protein BKA67DRAFT_520710 [Truncatella angustata]